MMSGSVQTSSDGLCKLVRWAHSHGTICSLIPSLQHLSHGSHGNVLTTEPGPHGGSVTVAVWGCSAGHAYHWPIGSHDNSSLGSDASSQGQERFATGRSTTKLPGRGSCDLSCSEPASEGEEFGSRLFDIGGCDSSATDEDGDYEPRLSRKRSAPGAGSGGTGKKIKQEASQMGDFYAEAGAALANDILGTETDSAEQQASQSPQKHPRLQRTPSPHRPPHGPQTQPPGPGEHGEQRLACEGLMDPEMELVGGGASAPESTEQTTASQSELDRLWALLRVERSRTAQMTLAISSLKQDKELLQHELTKKAELICDFLQDQLRPEKRRPQSSNQMEPGSSHMPFPDDAAAFDSPALFDSFEEVELHPLERHRSLKTKRSRDGENTRVRMKNVVGVIARYMAALQEFRRSVSMKVAFDRVGVDRNTISRTAAIAELSLAAPEVFHALAPWDEKEETLAHYALRCRLAMDDNIKAKIKTMKAKGDLLPIVSK